MAANDVVESIEALIENGKITEAETLVRELEGEAKFIYAAKIEAIKGNWQKALNILLPKMNKRDDAACRLAGYIFFNNERYEEAYAYFRAIKKKTVDDDFMLTLLATFHEDVETAKQYLRSAFAKDASRLKELMKYFYKVLVEPHPHLSTQEKKELWNLLKEQKI